jgi:hypothetical protein
MIPHSYSRIKEFETCGLRFYETVILKKWGAPRSAAILEGDEIHAAMATALTSGTPLPAKFRIHQKWIDKLLRTDGELFVEQKWAITQDFEPTTWNSERAWFRSVADGGKINIAKRIGCAVDWKSGKSIHQKDDLQLILIGLCMLIHYPELEAVRTDYVWLNEEHQTTKFVYRRYAADLWAKILPRIQALEAATTPDDYLPKYNSFCKRFCPVKICLFHGQ